MTTFALLRNMATSGNGIINVWLTRSIRLNTSGGLNSKMSNLTHYSKFKINNQPAWPSGRVQQHPGVSPRLETAHTVRLEGKQASSSSLPRPQLFWLVLTLYREANFASRHVSMTWPTEWSASNRGCGILFASWCWNGPHDSHSTENLTYLPPKVGIGRLVPMRIGNGWRPQ